MRRLLLFTILALFTLNVQTSEVNMDKELECLALNIYFEARDQDINGMKAVAFVTKKRAEDKRFPKTLCGVVKSSRKDTKGRPIRWKCAFSWYCDGLSDRPSKKKVEQRAYALAKEVAKKVMLDSATMDFTHGSLFYHHVKVRPGWSKNKRYIPTIRIGDHQFYRLSCKHCL